MITTSYTPHMSQVLEGLSKTGLILTSDNLKTTLQTFFDKRKKNDCTVKMSGPLGKEEEYAYDFVPVVDYRLNGMGI